MIPKEYNHTTTCRNLNEEDFYLIQNDTELAELLDTVSLPKKYRDDITGAIVIIGDGNYDAIWLSESPRYYDLSAYYHALPYYKPVSWHRFNLPIYWKEENPEYTR